jgi:hypothetical protein
LIDFRYHIVSIVAVFLALAVGIVLGSTALQGDTLSVLESTSNYLHSELTATTAQRDADAAQASAAESFLQTSESLVFGDGRLLAGHKVLLVVEPGAPSAVTGGVKAAAAAAGATVTGQVGLQPAFNDVSGANEATLSTVNSSVAAADGSTLAVGTNPQTTSQLDAAQLIATAVLEKQQPQQNQRSQQNQGVQSAASAQTVLNDYAQAGFITTAGTPTTRADVVVIVAPGSVPPEGASDPLNQVLVTVAQEFAGDSAVTVVAEDTVSSAQSGSAVSVVRSNTVAGQVSTIDDADLMLGQLTVMQAIATQLAGGHPSSYGISGAASVAPAVAPTPSQTPTPGTQPTGQPSNSGNSGKQVKKK